MAQQQRVETTRKPSFGLPNLLLERSRSASRIRLVAALTAFGGYWFLVTLLADFPPMIPIATLEGLPLLVGVLLDVGTSFINPRVLVYLLPLLLGGLVAFRIASLYLADLFELESIGIASRYLIGSVFGFRYPALTIGTGRITELDQDSPLLRIGGPGYLNLHLGFAAVFETIDGKPKIYGPSPARSQFFIQGFERLRDVIDLRDQLRKLDEVRTVTKDGITVHARGVQIVFRAFGGTQRKPGSRYHADPASTLSLAYGGIAHDDGLSHWTETLPELAKRELQAFVAARTLEEFLALPEQASEAREDDGRPMTVHIPRRLLTSSFHTPERQQRLKDLGLELVWVGVGTWEVRDDQIPSTELEIAAGQTLTGTARDEARAQRLRSPEFLGKERELRTFALTREVIEELVVIWREGQLPDRYRCYEWLERFKRRLLNLQERIDEAVRLDQAIGIETELPEGFQDLLLHMETLTDRSPTL
jgi:hypothetical protein